MLFQVKLVDTSVVSVRVGAAEIAKQYAEKLRELVTERCDMSTLVGKSPGYAITTWGPDDWGKFPLPPGWEHKEHTGSGDGPGLKETLRLLQPFEPGLAWELAKSQEKKDTLRILMQLFHAFKAQTHWVEQGGEWTPTSG